MLRDKLCLAVLAALMVAPVASQGSVLSRRLTIRYPGQDARHHHHHRWGHNDHRWDDRHDHRWVHRRDR